MPRLPKELRGNMQSRRVLIDWLTRVCYHLNLRKVVARGVKAGTWTADKILKLRSDEPQDTFDLKDSPRQYADFLELEYELYGPDGE